MPEFRQLTGRLAAPHSDKPSPGLKILDECGFQGATVRLDLIPERLSAA
jgi:hypothetical protein